MKCNKLTSRIFRYSIIVVIALLCTIHYYKRHATITENFELKTDDLKAFYINLDKNTKRNKDFLASYKKSDMHDVGLTRFNAILGKTVNFESWLTPDAIEELHQTEETKERIYHYQLTYGGVGCFLSHYMLAKQLLEDDSVDYYIIFEDDVSLLNKSLSIIRHYLRTAPDDWDIIQFAKARIANYTRQGAFNKPSGFWGMYCYLINKKGAQKLVDEVQSNRIDGQIDAYLSRMAQQKKINIYIADRDLIQRNANGNMSDIQYRLKRSPSHVNPFNYKGYIV